VQVLKKGGKDAPMMTPPSKPLPDSDQPVKPGKPPED
jgi:hypothetical protein